MKQRSALEQLYWDRYEDFVHRPQNLKEALLKCYGSLSSESAERFSNEIIDLVEKGCLRLIGTYPCDQISVHEVLRMKKQCLTEMGRDNIAVCELTEALGRTIIHDSKDKATFLDPFEGSFHCPDPTIMASYADKDCQEGMEHFQQNEISAAVRSLDVAAKEGSREAGLFLGHLYFTGSKVEENTLRGLFYYYLAAIHGSPEASYNLGLCYARGIGVLKDRVLAQRYLRLALDGGLVEAKEELNHLAD